MVFEGLFKAPATGQYRFTQSCTNRCVLKINNDTVADPLDPTTAEKLMEDAGSTYRKKNEVLLKSEDNVEFEKKFSKQISLTQDKYYYIEAVLQQYGKFDELNIDVGMEVIPDILPSSHPNAETQIQQISIAQTNILYDTMEITVVKPDQLVYRLALLKPGTTDYHRTGDIVSGCSADDMKTALDSYYTSLYSVSPVVTATYYDGSASETTADSSTVNSIKYTITVPIALSGESVSSAFELAISTSSTIDIVTPANKQLSSPPITGSFWVECHNEVDQAFATQDMDIGISDKDFLTQLETDCSFLRGKVNV